ncbi:putative metallopeptidase-like protein [Halomonas sp. A11-A]|nr:putative metallopeptidase-like protein [Halomonas sp. A11-A]
MRQDRSLGTSRGATVAMAAEQVAAWQRDRLAWAEHHPVTAALAEPLEVVPVDEPWLATATTDGRCLVFNPAWSAELSELQRRQVQEHLVWHAAAGDYRPRNVRDPRRWHLACDHAINTQLMQLGAELPMDAVLFPFAITWRRREVYGWLDEHPFLELEQSADQLAWQARATLPVTDLTDLEEDWRQHVRATVRHYLGTAWLPDSVAGWLLGRR